MSRARIVMLGAAAAAFGAAAWTAVDPADSGLSLLLAACALIVAAAAWLETGPGSAKELALIATLAAVAAAGRVLFAAVPGVQPVTVIVVVAGAALGLRAGIAVGATAALVSNFFLGQGPWTPWQLALFCCVLGFGFSAFRDVWNWLAFFPHTWQALAAIWARGLWFDAAHAVGNFVIALVAGPARLFGAFRE